MITQKVEKAKEHLGAIQTALNEIKDVVPDDHPLKDNVDTLIDCFESDNFELAEMLGFAPDEF